MRINANDGMMVIRTIQRIVKYRSILSSCGCISGSIVAMARTNGINQAKKISCFTRADVIKVV